MNLGIIGSEQEQRLLGYLSTFSCLIKARLQRFICFTQSMSTRIYIVNFFSFNSALGVYLHQSQINHCANLANARDLALLEAWRLSIKSLLCWFFMF